MGEEEGEMIFKGWKKKGGLCLRWITDQSGFDFILKRMNLGEVRIRVGIGI